MTRSAVSSLTRPRVSSLRARETVPGCTFAARATSRSVTEVERTRGIMQARAAVVCRVGVRGAGSPARWREFSAHSAANSPHARRTRPELPTTSPSMRSPDTIASKPAHGAAPAAWSADRCSRLQRAAIGASVPPVPNISYFPPENLEDPELRGYLEHAAKHGTPRPESQAIRAHVPAVLRAFSRNWDAVFRNGVLEHRIKELCRVYVSQTIDCHY